MYMLIWLHNYHYKALASSHSETDATVLTS